MAYDNLSGETTCPICGEVVKIVMQMHFAEGGPRRWFHVGDPVKVSEGFVRDCMPVGTRPWSADAVRLCEHVVRHCDCLFWLVVEIVGGRLGTLGLVEPSVSVVDSVDLIDREMAFSTWSGKRRFIDVGFADRLATQNSRLELRQGLFVYELLPVRNFHEAELMVQMLELGALGPRRLVVAGGRRLWEQDCTHPPRSTLDLTLRFVVATEELPETEDGVVPLPDGPSRVLSADYLRDLADAEERAAPEALLHLDWGQRNLDQWERAARRSLGQAVVYLQDLLAFIPAGASAVPAETIWGDAARADWAARPQRYGRAHLEATLAVWRAELAQAGRGYVVDARTAEEAALYMLVCPCPICGRATPPLASTLVAEGNDLIAYYEGDCECVQGRRFRIRIAEALPPVSTDDVVTYGEGTSPCLDAGALVAAAAQLEAWAVELVEFTPTAEERAAAEYRMLMAIGALDEALKFVSAEADAVPPESLFTRVGIRTYDADPAQFTRAALTARRAELVAQWAGWRDKES